MIEGLEVVEACTLGAIEGEMVGAGTTKATEGVGRGTKLAEVVKAVMTGAIEEVTGVVELGGGAGMGGVVKASVTEATLAASVAMVTALMEVSLLWC